MPYSLRGTIVEAQHNPTVETNIMLEFLAEALLGKMPLVSTNKLFKSPLGLFFECCGINRAVPIIIDTIEVFIDFHIFAILEFDLLIGYRLDKLFEEKPSHGSLDEKFGKTTSAIPIFYPEIPMAKHHPNHDPFEEVKFISPFISHRFPCETGRPLSPSFGPKPCPSGHQNVILDSGRESTKILHNENSCAMDILETPTLESKRRDSINEHESFTFETPRVSCSLSKSPEFVSLSTQCFYEDHNHLLILVSKLFKMMVVDAFVYHKYCKSQSCTMALTL